MDDCILLVACTQFLFGDFFFTVQGAAVVLVVVVMVLTIFYCIIVNLETYW